MTDEFRLLPRTAQGVSSASKAEIVCNDLSTALSCLPQMDGNKIPATKVLQDGMSKDRIYTSEHEKQ